MICVVVTGPYKSIKVLGYFCGWSSPSEKRYVSKEKIVVEMPNMTTVNIIITIVVTVFSLRQLLAKVGERLCLNQRRVKSNVQQVESREREDNIRAWYINGL